MVRRIVVFVLAVVQRKRRFYVIAFETLDAGICVWSVRACVLDAFFCAAWKISGQLS